MASHLCDPQAGEPASPPACENLRAKPRYLTRVLPGLTSSCPPREPNTQQVTSPSLGIFFLHSPNPQPALFPLHISVKIVSPPEGRHVGTHIPPPPVPIKPRASPIPASLPPSRGDSLLLCLPTLSYKLPESFVPPLATEPGIHQVLSKCPGSEDSCHLAALC